MEGQRVIASSRFLTNLDLSSNLACTPGVNCIADIISVMSPIVDPRPYHPDRFQRSAWSKVADF